MEQKILKHLYNSFAELVEKYGFSKVNEVNEGQSYWIEYGSTNFVFKLEKYRKEFYATLYKTGNPVKEVDLFNLLAYLNEAAADIPESEYFRKEKDIEECYKKQLSHISATLYEHYEAINNFFSSKNIDLQFSEIREFMLKKYPELFKKTK
jgi:hypothetical protein